MKPALIGGVIFVMVILIIAVISFRSDEQKGGEVTQQEPVTQQEKVQDMMQQQANTGGVGVAGAGAEVEEEEDEEPPAEEPPAAKEEIPEDEPELDPKNVKGLVGHYTAESFDERANVWKDVSGNDNHADEIKGEPEVVEEGGIKFLLGGASSGVRFPTSVLTNGRRYTMIAVSKINSKMGGGRLFDGYGNGANYVSGYHWSWPYGQRATNQPAGFGGAHRTGSWWIAHNDQKITDENVDNWILTTDQKHSFRLNGIQRSGLIRPVAVAPNQMTINYGDYTKEEGLWWQRQNPEWSVAEILFFNKELDLETTRKIETHLMKKYKIRREMRPRVNVLNSWNLEKGQMNQTIDDCTGGSTCAKQFRALDRLGVDCGEEGTISRVNLHRHGRNIEKTGGNGRIWYESTCINGLNPGRTSKKTAYVNIADETPMDSKYKKFDMTCRQGGLSNFEWEKSNDGSRMRIKYGCSNTPVNENSCREIKAMRYGLEVNQNYKSTRNNERNPNLGPLTALDTQALDCGNGQVLTSVQYAEENNLVRLKGMCCNLQDE
jgi:hypothetical protein